MSDANLCLLFVILPPAAVCSVYVSLSLSVYLRPGIITPAGSSAPACDKSKRAQNGRNWSCCSILSARATAVICSWCVACPVLHGWVPYTAHTQKSQSEAKRPRSDTHLCCAVGGISILFYGLELAKSIGIYRYKWYSFWHSIIFYPFYSYIFNHLIFIDLQLIYFLLFN